MSKIRPGVYINVTGTTKLSLEAGARGVLVLPLSLNFGAEGEFISIKGASDCLTKLGYSLNSSEMLPIREALKNASEVLVYRLNSGTKASATSTGLTMTAKYAGTRGNDIGVIVTVDSGVYSISVRLDGTEVEYFKASTVADIDSAYVDFTGTLVACDVTLEDGTNTTSATAFDDMLEAATLVDFNVIAYTGTAASEITKLVEFVKEQRDQENKKIVGVYGASTNTADHEGLIVVLNGVKLADGTVLDKNAVCAWVGGASAGAKVTESCTFKEYAGAVDVDVRYTNTQIENYLSGGFFLFVARGTKVCVEYDINSLKTYTATKPEEFHKNKVIRVLDGIANDIKSIYEAHFIGKVQNNEDGRAVLKGNLCEYMKNLEFAGAIEDFEAGDITIARGETSESVVINVGVKPTDTVDKIYINVEVE